MARVATMQFRVEYDRNDGTVTVGVRFYNMQCDQFRECRLFYCFLAEELRKEGTQYGDVQTFFNDRDNWVDQVQFVYLGDTSGFAFWEQGEEITNRTHEILKNIGDNVMSLFMRYSDYFINV